MRIIVSFIWVCCLMLAGLGTASDAADVRKVATATELQEALREAKAGLQIDLAPGDYGKLELRKLALSADETLTLRSADPTKLARFSGLILRKVSNVVIENVVLDYTFKRGDKLHLRPFQVLNSQNVVIKDTHFEGDVAQGRGATDDGFPTAFGLGVTNSSNVTVQNNRIHLFHRGIVVSQSQNVTVRGNNVYQIRSDGMNFADVQDLRIEKNYIHDFKRSPNSKDHADMIQFWTKNTKQPSRNVMIRDNVLSSGRGLYTQSIFMRNDQVDRGLAGPEMFYRNITIQNNMIINAHLHGITVGETDGLIIRNNTVVRNPTSQGKSRKAGLWTPQIRVAETSRDVKIIRNVTSAITGPAKQLDWNVTGNFFVQNVIGARPGFYEGVFGLASMQKPQSPASFATKAGGPLDNTGIGASLFLPN